MNIQYVAYLCLLEIIFRSLSFAGTTDSAPMRVKVDGLVCSYCARGVSEVLRNAKGVDHYSVEIPKGEVWIWMQPKQAKPSRKQVRDWIEKSGLQVAEDTPGAS